MLRTLFKKQFLELNAFYFQNRKTGKRRSRGGVIGFAVLFSLALLLIAFAFFGLSLLMLKTLLPAKMDWLFFSMMGLMSVALGTFGSVFNTYAGLYHARDNELLLSMPIPPRLILTVRMSGVFLMSLLYSALIWVPAVVAYCTEAPFNALGLIFSILLQFVLAGFVTVLSCALGWVVALISGKLKNKSVITAVLTLAFLAVYYSVYFRFTSLLQSIVLHYEQVSGAIRTWFYPFYQLGFAATGEVMPMVIFTAITAALLALCVWVLSRSFIGIVTSVSGGKKAVYQRRASKLRGLDSALLRKEFARFTSSPTYLINGGLGTLLVVGGAVYALTQAKNLCGLCEAFSMIVPWLSSLLPVFVVVAICLVLSLDATSAPSVSMEGRSLWIVQTLPVDPKRALRAKLRLHLLVNGTAAVIAAILMGIALRMSVISTILSCAAALAFIAFTGSFGLMMNLKKPNLTWTNETVPIKQSGAVAMVLFGSMAVMLLLGGGAILLRALPGWVYLLIMIAVLCIPAFLFLRWIDRKGAEIYAYL